MKLKIKLPDFIFQIGNLWWVFWSNIRWCRATKNFPLREEDTDKELANSSVDEFYEKLPNLINNIYKTFTWTEDGPDQLWDSIRPPAQCYEDAVNGALNDDCDGYHSAIYWLLKNNGIESYLISVANRNGKSAHCVYLGKDTDGHFFVVNYQAIDKLNATTLKETKAEIKKLFENSYGIDPSVSYFDYNNKFKKLFI